MYFRSLGMLLLQQRVAAAAAAAAAAAKQQHLFGLVEVFGVNFAVSFWLLICGRIGFRFSFIFVSHRFHISFTSNSYGVVGSFTFRFLIFVCPCSIYVIWGRIGLLCWFQILFQVAPCRWYFRSCFRSGFRFDFRSDFRCLFQVRFSLRAPGSGIKIRPHMCVNLSLIHI